jgi:hypothetical protein
MQQTLPVIDQFDQMDRISQETSGPQIQEAKKKIPEFLNHAVPAYRRAARMALVTHELSRTLCSREEVEGVLQNLIDRQILEYSTTSEGKLVYRMRYQPHASSCFGEEEVAKIEKILESLLSKVEKEEHQRRQEVAKSLQDQATISLQSLLDGKEGLCALSVPPERVERAGQEFWRGGGTFLVRSDGEKIFPVAGSGSIERAVTEICEMRIFLILASLESDKPPFVPQLRPEQGRKLQLLWHLMKRGIKNEEELQQTLAVREQMQSQATISMPDFFLDEQLGTCLVDFQGSWKTDGQRPIRHVFLLVSREVNGDATTRLIRVAEIPPHLGGFLGRCNGRYPEGERFSDLPQPLKAVLQATYKQVEKQERISATDEQPAADVVKTKQ